jgi:hypothetical protein
VNGDGFDDVLVGGTYVSTGSAYVMSTYVVFGPMSGEIDMGTADATLQVGPGTHSGTPVQVRYVSSGTNNTDNYSDTFIGAYGDDSGGTSSGAAYLFEGPISGYFDETDADAAFVGESSGDTAGTAVSSSGDVNGDGIDDFVVGAPHESTAGSNAGAVYVVLGPASGTVDLSTADGKFLGENSSDMSGWSLACSGDADGDGNSDILIGAWMSNSGGTASGAAFLILGPSTGATASLTTADAKLVGESDQDFAGYSLDIAGDVDGDGTDDLLVGAMGSDGYSGATYLVLGPVSGTQNLSSANAILRGENTHDASGGNVAFAGDVDNDMQADILVGAKYEGAGGHYAGAAYLVLGGGL